MMRTRVCVFCASSDVVVAPYKDAAAAVGRYCAQNNIRLVYGAGAVGLMGACADACLQEGGSVTGVIPQFMIDRGWCREGLTELIVTSDMAVRRQTMRQLSDGVIVLPGGCGTLEELFETMTQRQMGFYPHPIILLNQEGFFDAFIEWIRRAVAERFMRSEHEALWTVAHTVEEAFDLFKTLPDDKPGVSARMIDE